MTITVDELTTPTKWPDFKRTEPADEDQRGKPLIKQADGTHVEYGGPSWYAKSIENTWNIERWAERMVAIGVAGSRTLQAEITAALDDKKKLNDLVKKAKDAAKANDAADLGTALHQMFEDVITGRRQLDSYTSPWREDIEAVLAEFARHGLTPDPDWCEVKVVHDDLKLAGTCDIAVPYSGEGFIGDFKTGQWKPRGIGYAVQQFIYATSIPYDTVHEERRTWPWPMSTETALIIWCKAGSGKAKIYDVPLARAGEMCELARTVRSVRDKGYAFVRKVAKDAPKPPVDHLHVDILDRIDAIKENEAAFLALRTQWPAGVPTPKNAHQWTDEHVDKISAVVVTVERDHSLPFLPEPFEKPPTTLAVVNSEPTPDPEGPRNEALAAELQARIAALPQEARDVLNGWAFEANASGSSLSLKQLPSERRCQIVRICVAALDSVDDVDEKMRGFLALNLGTERVQDAFTTGAVLGSLAIAEATRLAEIIDN